MRKNRLIALIGTLTMAAAGLAAVSAGVSSKKTTSVKASSDQTYIICGSMNGWNTSDETYKFSWNGNDSQYEIRDVSLTSGAEFKVTRKGGWDYQFTWNNYRSGGTNFSNSNGNIKVNTTGRYDMFAKDWDNWDLYISKASYSITLEKNGGSISSGTDWTSYQYGETKTLPTLTKANCTFNGWYDNSTFTGSPVTQIIATDHGNKQFYAKFTDSRVDPSSTLKTYYVVDHGGISENSTFYVYGFGEASTVKPMSWPGKTGSSDAFAKLIEDPQHTGQKVYKVDLSESYSKLILNNNNGKQTVNIEDLSDHVGDVIHISTTTDGEGHYNYEWLDPSELDIANGYWIRNENGTYLSHLELDPNNNQQYKGQVTLNAGDQFKIVNRIDFKLYSDQYYGYSQLEDYNESARHAGQLVEGSSDSIKVASGYGGTYTVYHRFNYDNNKIAIPALVTHTVTYEKGADDATGTAPTQANVVEGGTFTVAANTFTRNGYTFNGWKDGGGTSYAANDTYTVGTSDVVLTAQWTANTYQVQLDNGEGSGQSSVTATFNASMPDVTVPEYEDHNFLGYFTGSDGTGTQYYDEFGKSAHAYDDNTVTKLYAKWEAATVRHTVTFAVDGEWGSVDKDHISVIDGATVSVVDNKVTITDATGSATITATPISGTTDHYNYFFDEWTLGLGGEVPTTIDDDYQFLATFRREGESHTITLANTDERGGEYEITQKYDPNGYDVTEEVINQYTGGNPLGRTYVGLKVDPTSTTETPFTHVVFDDDYTYHISYAFNDASCYEYSFDGLTYYPFTSHRDSEAGEPGYLQVYCVDQINVTAGDILHVRYRVNEQSEYQNLTLNIDQSSNLAANGKVRNTASSTYLNLRFIYNESTKNYSYEATLGGMPESGHWLSIDGVLHQVEQNPSNPNELQVLNVSIAKDQIVKMYHAQTRTWYTCSLDTASQGTWTAVTDGLQCGEGRNYNVYIKQSSPGNYDQLYFGYAQMSPQEEAVAYAKSFLDKMGSVCIIGEHGAVETQVAELQLAWQEMYTAYQKLSDGAQDLLKNASANPESTDWLEKFAWSYNYVYGKYKTELDKNDGEGHTYGGNFAHRDVTPISQSRLISVNDISTSTWIIASVAIIGIAAVGVFFIYKKRKEI